VPRQTMKQGYRLPRIPLHISCNGILNETVTASCPDQTRWREPLKVLVHQNSAVSAQFSADAADTMQGHASIVYYRVVSVARGGTSSALNCHGGRPFPPPHRPPRLDTCTRTLIPVLSVDMDQLGGVKVGSNNLGGGNAFDPMSTAARLYWPHQQ
jgi:hypothetical protein